MTLSRLRVKLAALLAKPRLDGGVAVGLFNPVRAELGGGAVLLVDTDYPYEDSVRVLLAGLTKPTSLQVTVVIVR